MTPFSEQLISARKTAGWTQEQLAEQMHVSRQTVSHWETGRAVPDDETLARLRKLLNLPEETAEPSPVKPVSPVLWLLPVLIAAIGLCIFCGVFLQQPDVPAAAPQITAEPQATMAPPTQEPILPADYPLEWYLNPAPNADSSRAYVELVPRKTPVRLENLTISEDPMWPVGFDIVEKNGVSFTIDKISLIHFAKDGTQLASEVYAARDLREFMNDVLADGNISEWNNLTSLYEASYYCMAVEGTDAGGNKLAFGNAIELINEMEEIPVRSDFDASPEAQTGRAHMQLAFQEGDSLYITRGGNEYSGEDAWVYHLELENTGDAPFTLNSFEFVYFSGEEVFTKAEYNGEYIAEWRGEGGNVFQPGDKWVMDVFEPLHPMDMLGIRIKGTDGQEGELFFTAKVNFLREYPNDEPAAE